MSEQMNDAIVYTVLLFVGSVGLLGLFLLVHTLVQSVRERRWKR